jgi:hypothetical protein
VVMKEIAVVPLPPGDWHMHCTQPERTRRERVW